MDRFFTQLETWLQGAGTRVGDFIGLIQQYAIIAVAVIVILAGIAYLLGLISLRWLEQVKSEWLGSILVGLFLIFGVGTILVALLP
jgi:hypothetical protein